MSDTPTLRDFEKRNSDPAAAMRVHVAALAAVGGNAGEYEHGMRLAYVEALDRERPLPLSPKTASETHDCVSRLATRRGVSYVQALQLLADARRDGATTLAELLRPGDSATAAPAQPPPLRIVRYEESSTSTAATTPLRGVTTAPSTSTERPKPTTLSAAIAHLIARAQQTLPRNEEMAPLDYWALDEVHANRVKRKDYGDCPEVRFRQAFIARDLGAMRDAARLIVEADDGGPGPEAA